MMKINLRETKKYQAMTIIEMLVAISIFTLGIGGFALLFSKVWQANSFAIEMGQSSMQASQGVNTMAGYIRKAQQGDNGSYPIISATGNDLVLYSDYNNDGITERLHFYKNGQNVLMGVTSSTNTMPKTYPAGDQQVRTLAGSIVNDSSTPIFYYYNNDYPVDTTNNPLTSPVDFSIIRLIKIYLQININPIHAPDNIEMQTFIKLRNLNN